MPQNNTDITSSLEFKEFCKNNNLEVFNLESFQLALFTSCYADRHILDRIQKLEERLDSAYKAIERLGAFAQTKDCDVWQLCNLDIDKLEEYQKEKLFSR